MNHLANEGIELLYMRECPAWPQALENLEAALHELNLKEEPKLIAIDTMAQALQFKFFSSPTIHINGIDIDPHLRNTNRRGLAYGRPYFFEGKSFSAPTVEQIKTALEELYFAP